MTLPMQKDIELPLLQEIEAAGGEAHYKGLCPKIAKHFPQITPADLQEKVQSGVNRWENRVQFARQRLVNKGELEPYYKGGPGGLWRITDKGRARLRTAGTIPLTPTLVTTQAIEKVEKPPPSTHDELVQIVKQIGEKLGKTVEVNWGPVYRYDNVWRRKVKPYAQAQPGWVVEICAKGNLDKDIASLNWAVQTWGAKGVLVIVDQQDFEAAQKKLTGRKQIYIVEADTMCQLHSLLQANADFLRTLFG